MAKPYSWKVGEVCTITENSWKVIYNSNRSLASPSDDFLAAMKRIIGKTGYIKYRHKPGYEVTVDFEGLFYHMKDNWFESLHSGM